MNVSQIVQLSLVQAEQVACFSARGAQEKSKVWFVAVHPAPPLAEKLHTCSPGAKLN